MASPLKKPSGASDSYRFDRVALYVRDFQLCLRFYRDQLGLPVAAGPHGEWVAFDIGGTTFAVLGSDHGGRGTGSLGIFIYVNNIRTVKKRLQARGVKFVNKVRKMPFGVYLTTFVDPEGNEISLSEPVRAAGKKGSQA